MRDTAEARHLAPADELAAVWPGGAQNALTPEARALALWARDPHAPDADDPLLTAGPGPLTEAVLGAWVYCYGQMVRIIDRREQRDPDNEEGQRLLAKVLGNVPVKVDLIMPVEDRAVVWVHPKGHDALVTLAEMERVARETRLWRDALTRVVDPSPEERAARATVVRVLARLQATFAWIVTHPGSGLPYPDRFVLPWDHEAPPPSWCYDLDSRDYLRLAQAHTLVNIGRLRALPRVEGGDGTGWATFFVSLAEQLRVPEADLMATRPLAGLLAHSAIAADTYRRAQAKAKASSAVAPPVVRV